MEIRVLNYFVETANHKSMTKAAKKLHVTQPTLSKQLKDLEEELGRKLFNRSKYSINLTPEGEILYKRAVDILSIVDKTEAEFKSMNDFNGGDIHIGCAESYGITVIAETIKALTKKYPNVRFHLYSGNFQTVTEQLNNGLLDFAITVQDVNTSLYNSLTLPYTDKWGLLMRRDSSLAANTSIQLGELANIPLIISRQGFSDEMPNELKNMQANLNIIGTYDLLYNASLFVKQGLGYAFCFDKLVDTSLESELLFVPIEPVISSPMRIIWPINQTLSKSTTLFFEELKNK
ncbi:LysR family transcriptional regulator [Tuanshanicoccus lijuaniae]|uniref:LysR family transcriptional regulator n=1 Tax=Aerococcaceae bacterium zg-1292 TaxID=2774330 RepID=UPI0019370F28|nr:LysR family transcriptional regulator [Aerococcaceae bacterium zg-1292]MBF6626613.1 LysR family transcriptional regulator [Aerococcaceae bacterium zg-BR9]MBF6978978.1 LysR family transcriptional regulator [Aerococcaceae bacterium zg-BR22]MBS4455412.1 LysR family transcriptional regulator [Aerococcaceae bacterium zg-A91]MBS4457372.1 LysR family transcriptional regulator [Aerococcaceae bacterium zg-BR33]